MQTQNLEKPGNLKKPIKHESRNSLTPGIWKTTTRNAKLIKKKGKLSNRKETKKKATVLFPFLLNEGRYPDVSTRCPHFLRRRKNPGKEVVSGLPEKHHR